MVRDKGGTEAEEPDCEPGLRQTVSRDSAKTGMRALKTRSWSSIPCGGGTQRTAEGVKETPEERQRGTPGPARGEHRQCPQRLVPEHLLNYKDNFGKTSFQITSVLGKSGGTR